MVLLGSAEFSLNPSGIIVNTGAGLRMQEELHWYLLMQNSKNLLLNIKPVHIQTMPRDPLFEIALNVAEALTRTIRV
jgi:hypothetical protein